LHILYLDESGDPYGWHRYTHFVLGGVAVHEGQVTRLAKALDGIQAQYFPKISIPINFHAEHIRVGRGLFSKLHPNVREMILSDIYDLINLARSPNLVAFATAIHITAVKSPSQVLRDALEDLTERFNTFLLRQHKAGRTSKGLLIIDQAHQERYRELLREFQIAGTKHGYLGNVIDIPYFAGAQDTRMLQLADHCAYATFRYYEYNDLSQFKKVLPRFDKRGPDLPPAGLKHITKEACNCAACSWR